MKQLNNWVMGLATTIMAIGGLFIASNSGSGLAYYAGLVFFLFAVLFIFYLIRLSFNREND